VKPYSELEALAPEKYLDWEFFVTDFDAMPVNRARAQEAYEKGLETGRENEVVFVTGRGTWGAKRPDCQTTSYEGIGYHANTAHFWHGVLDSGCRVEVYRYRTTEPVVIKE